jgi:hypothetical protein
MRVNPDIIGPRPGTVLHINYFSTMYFVPAVFRRETSFNMMFGMV